MQRFIQSLVVLSILIVTAMPLQAKPMEPGERFSRVRERLVRFIRAVTVRTFGDGLSDPRP